MRERKRIMAAVLLLFTLAGCTALREITQPFRDDPATAALRVVRDQVLSIRTNVFIPRDLASPSGLCSEPACATWRQWDDRVTIAHNTAEKALKTTSAEESRASLALRVAEQALAGLAAILATDPSLKRQEVYQRAVAAIQAVMIPLRAALPGQEV